MSVRLPAIAVATALLVASACSDDDETGSTARGGPDDTGDVATSDDGAGDASLGTTAPADVDLDGEAVVISVMGGSEGVSRAPEVYDGAEAAAAAINADGGIADPAGGPPRPIEILTCDALVQVDPNSAINCARDAVDQRAVASAGKLSTGAESVTVLSEAGIPLVGSFVILPEDYTDELSFPLAGGTVTAAAGLGVLLQEQGAERIGMVVSDTPAAPTIESAITSLLDGGEDDMSVSVRSPADPSADRAPIMAQVVAADPDGVAILEDATKTGINIRALRDAGYDGPIAVASLTLTPEVIGDLGGLAEGVYGVSNFAAPATDDPAMERFDAEMDEFAPADAFRNEFSVNSWLSVHLVADLLAEADSIDAAGLVDALAGHEVADAAVPPFTLGETGIDFLPFPRVPRATVQFQVVEDGVLVPVGDGELADLNSWYTG